MNYKMRSLEKQLKKPALISLSRADSEKSGDLEPASLKFNKFNVNRTECGYFSL